MATLFEIKWRMSDEARAAHFVATGTKTDFEHVVRFDAETLTPDDRATLYTWTGEGLKDTLYDSRASEPTLADVLAYASCKNAKKRAQEIEQATYKLQSGLDTLQCAVANHNPDPSSYYDVSDADNADRLGLDSQPWRALHATVKANRATWQAEATEHARQKELADAARKAEAERQAKIAWATQHGSNHLRRALAAGHDCGRLYWIERAGVEYPGYTLDYEKNVATRSRSCPSVKALDERDAVLAAHPTATAEIEWITAPPCNRKRDADDYEEFEECEGITIDDPIYKHYLVKLL